MEQPLAPGDALDQEPRFLADRTDISVALRAALHGRTAFSAASAIDSATMNSNSDSRRTLRPSSTLVPSSRTTTGTSSLERAQRRHHAAAMRSLRAMPPKMLTRMAFTDGSET